MLRPLILVAVLWIVPGSAAFAQNCPNGLCAPRVQIIQARPLALAKELTRAPVRVIKKHVSGSSIGGSSSTVLPSHRPAVARRFASMPRLRRAFKYTSGGMCRTLRGVRMAVCGR